eukprot:GHVH01012917.1.p1 GENE.GHVH01012917.1~~GHVH01012917.1.p1  ORF type:complete len:202 (+),score=21.50 GHVH01012917.1:819-1424(+)
MKNIFHLIPSCIASADIAECSSDDDCRSDYSCYFVSHQSLVRISDALMNETGECRSDQGLMQKGETCDIASSDDFLKLWCKANYACVGNVCVPIGHQNDRCTDDILCPYHTTCLSYDQHSGASVKPEIGGRCVVLAYEGEECMYKINGGDIVQCNGGYCKDYQGNPIGYDSGVGICEGGISADNVDGIFIDFITLIVMALV